MKVIFDTNIWSYAIDRFDMSMVSTDSSIKILLPPSIYLEAARTNNERMRFMILNCMRKFKMERLQTEAFLEACEFCYAFNKTYSICKTYRVPGKLKEIMRFWTNDLYETDSRILHSEVLKKYDEDISELHMIQKENRKLIGGNLISRFDFSNCKVNAYGKEIFQWRFESFHIINESNPTMNDWIKYHFDLLEMKNTDRLKEFWFDKVNLQDVKRWWLRSVFTTAQSFYKILDSNAYDAQHISYLTDADIFFTADKNFFAILNEIYKLGKIRMAKPILIKAEEDIVKQIQNNLKTAA